MEVVTQPSYRSWYTRRKGTLLTSTIFGYISYFFVLISIIAARVFGEIDFIQTIIQYLMTVVVITEFVEDNGMHAYSHTCNIVEGFEGYDEIIASIASLQAWIILGSAHLRDFQGAHSPAA